MLFRSFPVLCEQYELLAKDMLRRWREGRPITFYHYMIDLRHGPCVYKRISGCGSGTEYMAVTPLSLIHICPARAVCRPAPGGDPRAHVGLRWP